MDLSEARAALSKTAEEYVNPAKALGALEPFKDAILTLRAKSASYERIAELLNQQDVEISVSSVRRFCRRYQKQIKQLRKGLSDIQSEDSVIKFPSSVPEQVPLSRNHTHIPRPPRDMRGPV